MALQAIKDKKEEDRLVALLRKVWGLGPKQRIKRETLKAWHRVWCCSSCENGKHYRSAVIRQCIDCGSPKEANDKQEQSFPSKEPYDDFRFYGLNRACQHCDGTMIVDGKSVDVNNEGRITCEGCGSKLDESCEVEPEDLTYRTRADWEFRMERTKHHKDPTGADPDWLPKVVRLAPEVGQKPPGDVVTGEALSNESGWYEQQPRPSRPARASSHTTATTTIKKPWLLYLVGLVVLIGISFGIYLHWVKSNTFFQTQVVPYESAIIYPLEDYQTYSYDESTTYTAGTGPTWLSDVVSVPSDAEDVDWSYYKSGTEPVYEMRMIADGCTRTVERSAEVNGATITADVEETYDCEKRVQVGTINVYTVSYSYTLDEWRDVESFVVESFDETHPSPLTLEQILSIHEQTANVLRLDPSRAVYHTVTVQYDVQVEESQIKIFRFEADQYDQWRRVELLDLTGSAYLDGIIDDLGELVEIDDAVLGNPAGYNSLLEESNPLSMRD